MKQIWIAVLILCTIQSRSTISISPILKKKYCCSTTNAFNAMNLFEAQNVGALRVGNTTVDNSLAYMEFRT